MPLTAPICFQQAIAFLVTKERAADALKWSDEAARLMPQNREMLLMKATTLEFAHQSTEAARLLSDLQVPAGPVACPVAREWNLPR